MARISIDLTEGWIKLAKSPVRTVIAALSCLSLSFGPLFLFTYGKEGLRYTDPKVIACFGAVFLIPLVYIRLASVVLTQVRESEVGTAEQRSETMASHGSRIVFWSIVALGSVVLYFLLRP